jgi:hypothetical protein
LASASYQIHAGQEIDAAVEPFCATPCKNTFIYTIQLVTLIHKCQENLLRYNNISILINYFAFHFTLPFFSFADFVKMNGKRQAFSTAAATTASSMSSSQRLSANSRRFSKRKLVRLQRQHCISGWCSNILLVL